MSTGTVGDTSVARVAKGWAAQDTSGVMAPFSFERRALRAEDVSIAIAYTGICHSDLHTARNDWGGTMYPVVPGHEIVGIVDAVGAGVTRHRVGDRVAVGCLVDSCLGCPSCAAGLEQFCRKGATGTYNSKDRVTGEPTYGGYSDHIVVRQEFVLKVPSALDLERISPVLCAGITTWSPLRHWKVGPGSKVAVAGLGGLGHMGVKLAVALGAEVTVLTTSPGKVDDAKSLGAHDVVVTTDRAAVKAVTGRFDFLLDTIPVAHDVSPLLKLLTTDGVQVLVGMIDVIPAFHSALLLGGRRTLTASPIGGIAETQELLDFCAEHDLHPDTETIAISAVNEAYARMERNDVKYRFVIDMSTL